MHHTSSSYLHLHTTGNDKHYNTQQYHTHYPPSPPSSTASNIEQPLIDDATLAHLTWAYEQQQIQQQAGRCMNQFGQHNEQFATTQPNIRIQSSSPLPPATYGDRQDSVSAAYPPEGIDWQRMYGMSMGGPVHAQQQQQPRSLKRQRSHQRTPSASTVGSNGPQSPYAATAFNPRIANTDYSPNSPASYSGHADFSKLQSAPHIYDSNFWNTENYIPSQAAHTNPQWSMRTFGLDTSTDDFAEFHASSHPSMSSHGNNTPSTPHSGVGDNGDAKAYVQNEARQMNGTPSSLFRTESSQAYQDELYNPQAAYTSVPAAPPRPQNELLTPHRNLVSERLQIANAARSASPASAMSRERSPFRAGSPLAPVGNNWNTTHLATAASMRQQSKQEAEQAELEAHKPTLRREPTKTMSPQDAVLDYNDSEQQAPLFQDTAPTGYTQHNGGADAWQSTFAGSTFGNLSYPTSQQPQMAPFRATASDANVTAYSSMPLPPVAQDQNQVFQAPTYAASSKPSYLDVNATPEFPAQLTSMESSVSDNAPPLSSQESYNHTSAPRRPADTRAATGTYTCTYHGCTQRFDSHANLQKHKREFHRSQQHQQQQRDSTSPGEDASASPSASVSPSARSTESPAPSAGMTSAALLARNSQAGPHKCTRINPSTNKPCNTIFSRPYDLTRHEDTIHNNRKQKVKCPMCREEKTFSRNDALTRHMRVVHPEVENFGKRGPRG